MHLHTTPCHTIVDLSTILVVTAGANKCQFIALLQEQLRQAEEQVRRLARDLAAEQERVAQLQSQLQETRAAHEHQLQQVRAVG